MPSSSYINGFDVIRIDADGVRVRMDGETLDWEQVGGGASDTVTSDEFGYVEGQLLSGVAAGTEVEFSLSGYPETFLRTTAADSESAAALDANKMVTFVVEDLSGETEAVAVELWAEDRSNTDSVDTLLGYGLPGETSRFPYKRVNATSQIRVYGNPVTDNGEKAFLRHEDALSADVEASAPDGGSGGTCCDYIIAGDGFLVDELDDDLILTLEEE